MQPITLTALEARVLAGLAALGLLVPNGIFLYYLFAEPAAVRAALANPVALVFVAEAFFLMFFFAWLLGRAGVRRPTGRWFVLLSLVGSMAFSVPATIWLLGKSRERPER